MKRWIIIWVSNDKDFYDPSTHFIEAKNFDDAHEKAFELSNVDDQTYEEFCDDPPYDWNYKVVEVPLIPLEEIIASM